MKNNLQKETQSLGQFIVNSIKNLLANKSLLVLSIIRHNCEVNFEFDWNPEHPSIANLICGVTEDAGNDISNFETELMHDENNYFYAWWIIRPVNCTHITIYSKGSLGREAIAKFLEDSLTGSGKTDNCIYIKNFATNDENVSMNNDEANDILEVYKSEFLMNEREQKERELQEAEERFEYQYERLSDSQKLLYHLRNDK